MPGVPFSKACETCKRRRVKCDDLFPCTPCLRLGKGPCPGYRPSTKFVDEGQRIRRKRTTEARDGDENGGTESDGLPSRIRDSPAAWRAYVPRPDKASRSRGASPPPRPVAFGPGGPGSAHLAVLVRSPPPRLLPLVSNTPFRQLLGESTASNHSLLRQGFEILLLRHIPVVHCGRLRFGLDIVPDSCAAALARSLRRAAPMPSYVWYLPARMGLSAVIDSALDVALTAAAYLALPAGAGQDPRAGVVLMRKLGVAVAALKPAIADPEECMGADVLAAVSLMSAYECINSTHAAAWMNHHKGLYRLLEKRGPARYKSDFERQLLLAAIGMIFTISLRGDFPCFLERPEWQAVFASKPADSIIDEEWTDSWRCLPLMCLVPSTMSSCRDIVRNRASQTAERIEALAASASRLRASLLDMAEEYDWNIPGRYAPVLAPRTADTDDWRLFNDAEDQRAANYANYLSALVILNRVILAVRPSATGLLEEQSRLAALEIQYLHTFVKTEPRLRKLYLVHAERVALSILLTSAHWAAERSAENGWAFDPGLAADDAGGNIIERWKFDTFDDILCARAVSTDYMLLHPAGTPEGSSASTMLSV